MKNAYYTMFAIFLFALPVSVFAASSITVTSPNSDGWYTYGNRTTIDWESENVDKVSIGWTTGSGSLNWIAYNIPNTGSYEWNIKPGNMSLGQEKSVKIYIIGYETGVGSATDESDEFFTVAREDPDDYEVGTTTDKYIEVTAPNGGEEWRIGTTNTITWAPYQYTPDINPAKDVNAYLQEKRNGKYVTVGEIMDNGKASIHTHFELDEYGNYAEPGEYYVYVVNEETGASDRSDNPFTLLPRTVNGVVVGKDYAEDIEVTAPNGGEEWRIGTTNTITWAPYDYLPKQYNPAKNVKAYLEEKRGSRYVTVGKILDNGKASLHTHFEIDSRRNYAEPGEYYVRVENTETGESDRSDESFTLLPMVQYKPVVPSTDKPSISLAVFDANKEHEIGDEIVMYFGYRNISSVSIALYEDNKWAYWIEKDRNVSGASEYIYTRVTTDMLDALDTGDDVKIYVTARAGDGSGYVDAKSKSFSIEKPQRSVSKSGSVGDITISELVELLIALGLVPEEKIDAIREIARNL